MSVTGSDSEIQQAATLLSREVRESTQHMSNGERAQGIEQMLRDLLELARNDGCVAAAWAYEFIVGGCNLSDPSAQ